MSSPLKHQKAVVDSGQWLLYRYNPDLALEGKNPFKLDSKPPKMDVKDFMNMENRFRMLTKAQPEVAAKYYEMAQQNVKERYEMYKYLSEKE
jgi:pyruvate-ferredoxin/flavodoxin oxidoreductase